MLCVTWDALNEAIPRLDAAEAYSRYLTNIAASENAGKPGHELAETWRDQANGGMIVSEETSFSGDRWAKVSMAAGFARVAAAFGDAIRE